MSEVKTLPTQNNGDFRDDAQRRKEIENKLSACIMLGVEIDSAFKLYSHRVIPAEVYISKVSELVQYYEKIANGTDNPS